mgnify:FL=1
MSDQNARENPIATLWRWIGLIQHGILRVFGIFFILFFLLAMPGCIAGLMMGLSGGDEFEMAENGVLKFEPNGVVVEEETRLAPDEALSGALLGGGAPEQIMLRDVVEGLRMAAEDDAVQTLLVNFQRLAGATPAALHEIAEEMSAFRDSGKEIIVYGDSFSNGSWFLAAHADEVHLHDYGQALVTGYGSFRTYFRSLLDNLMVTVNVYRVGAFKSALEPVLGDEMSEAAEEANRFLLGGIWDAYQRAAEDARGLERGALQTVADTAPDLLEATGGDAAQATLDANLVDALVGRAAFRDQMIERFGADEDGREVEGSDFFKYVDANRESQSDDGDTIAVVLASGNIVAGDGDGGVIGGDAHAELIRRARLDDDVRAIVLRIDSGGGSAFASELIREELELARLEGKVVIASMGGVAASGGYWIATPAQEIWAEPTTITGSIGIFGFVPTFENAGAQIGIYEDGVALTETARAPSVFGGVPESWDRMIQSNIEYGYERFLGIVAESRDMTRDEVDAVAQGRVWTGEQALERGLVDQLGGYDEAIAAAAERAGLEEGAYTVEIIEKPLTEFEQFIEDLGLETEARAVERLVFGAGLLGDGVFGDLARDAAGEIERINVLNDPNHVYATCLSCEAVRRFD